MAQGNISYYFRRHINDCFPVKFFRLFKVPTVIPLCCIFYMKVYISMGSNAIERPLKMQSVIYSCRTLFTDVLWVHILSAIQICVLCLLVGILKLLSPSTYSFAYIMPKVWIFNNLYIKQGRCIVCLSGKRSAIGFFFQLYAKFAKLAYHLPMLWLQRSLGKMEEGFLILFYFINSATETIPHLTLFT